MYYIGIDLGGTNIAVGIVDSSLKIIEKGSVPTKSKRPNDEIIADMAKLCRDLLERAGLTVDDVEYAGIATPGAVDPVRGIVRYSNNIKMLNYDISAKLGSMLGVKKIYVENDANAAAKGEAMAGAAKGASISVMVTLGTGVGGGIVIDGKIYSGFNHAGAELGHSVIRYDGRPCTCGRKGCWEAYSSATGLINMTKEKMESDRDTIMWDMVDGDISKVGGRTAFSAMKKGDRAGKEVVDMYISYLACGITNVINVFQPDVICIGGGVCNEGDYLIKPLVEIVNADQYTRNEEKKTEIRVATLGNDAGIIGAAALGM